MTEQISFWQGRNLLHIAPCPSGGGFVALRNGRVVGKAETKHAVVRMLILSTRWFATGAERES